MAPSLAPRLTSGKPNSQRFGSFVFRIPKVCTTFRLRKRLTMRASQVNRAQFEFSLPKLNKRIKGFFFFFSFRAVGNGRQHGAHIIGRARPSHTAGMALLWLGLGSDIFRLAWRCPPCHLHLSQPHTTTQPSQACLGCTRVHTCGLAQQGASKHASKSLFLL